MINIWLKRTTVFIYLLLLFLFVRHAHIVSKEVRSVITYFTQELLPLFFPFLILIYLILMNPEKTWLIKWIVPIAKKIFRVNHFGTLITCLSFISSFPMGAVMIKEGVKERLLTKQQAHHLLMFTNQASPVFITSIVAGSLFYHSTQAGMALIVIQWITNISIGIFGRFLFKPKSFPSNQLQSTNSDHPIHIDSQDIMIKATKTLLNIFTMILAARCVNIMLSSLQLFNFFSNGLLKMTGLPIEFSDLTKILEAMTEITLGINILSYTSFNQTILFIIVSTLLNFHGLSVHLQIYGLIKSVGLSFIPYFFSRLLAMILSCFYSYIYIQFASPFNETDAIQTILLKQKELSPTLFSTGLSSFYFLGLMTISYLVLYKIFSKKSTSRSNKLNT